VDAVPLEIATQAGALLAQVRARRPLVHHLANFVTMQAVAAATRAVGALPVMAMHLEDAEEIAGRADALILSLGTPTPERLEAMLAAGQRASERRIPIVLDPVGVGATAYRDAAARRILEQVRVTVVRANHGEAAALLGRRGTVVGVESATAGTHGLDLDDAGAVSAAPAAASTADAAGEAADELDTLGTADAAARAEAALTASVLARALGCVAAVTGPVDYVAGADRILAVENGHPWLAAVPGTGCMAASVVGAFCAVGDDPLTAAASGLACFGLAAEIASRSARGPGTLMPALLDALYHLTVEQVRYGVRVRPA
jgi:hydroxyethylthiazole kinase